MEENELDGSDQRLTEISSSYGICRQHVRVPRRWISIFDVLGRWEGGSRVKSVCSHPLISNKDVKKTSNAIHQVFEFGPLDPLHGT